MYSSAISVCEWNQLGDKECMIHCLKITIPNKYLISLLTEIDSGAKREYVIGRILRISDIDHIRRRCLTTLFIISQSPFFLHRQPFARPSTYKHFLLSSTTTWLHYIIWWIAWSIPQIKNTHTFIFVIIYSLSLLPIVFLCYLILLHDGSTCTTRSLIGHSVSTAPVSIDHCRVTTWHLHLYLVCSCCGIGCQSLSCWRSMIIWMAKVINHYLLSWFVNGSHLYADILRHLQPMINIRNLCLES